MYGMNAMSGAVFPLRESEGFLRLMTMFENPILGVLIGTLITAVCSPTPPPSVFCRRYP